MASRSSEHRSRFGGLWTDRLDASTLIEEGQAAGAFSADESRQLRHWIDHGWVTLPGAVTADVCEDVRRALESDRAAGGSGLIAQAPDGTTFPLGPDLALDAVRVVDVYWRHESARRALFSRDITAFLRLVFEAPPLLFQSLTFMRGSEQGMHQDTFFVVVDRPLELAAAWIALEDVAQGSGELTYYDRSHTIPEFSFGGVRKHWDPSVDGSTEIDEASRRLHSAAAELSLERQTFLPRRGDVFIWSADLVHGGSPITAPGATRASIVGHFCPRTTRPRYVQLRPDRGSVVPVGRGGEAYTSYWYDVDAQP